MYSPQDASTFAVFSSVSRTATHSSSVKRPPRDMRGVRFYIVSSAITDTPSVVFSIEVYDKTSEAWISLLDSAAVTSATAKVTLELGPGVAIVANRATGAHVGKGVRVTATHADSDAITYTVSGEWLP